MSALVSQFGPHARLVIPALAVGFMLLEYGLSRLASQDLHDGRETAATLGVAVGQHLIKAIEATFLAVPFAFTYAHRLFQFDPWSPLALAGLFLGSEFFYYWHHRASHRINWLWATHSVHHSPTRLNFTAAVRLGWTANLSGNFLFFLPLIWLGYPPFAVISMLGINLLYQFFIHTELVRSLGPLEWMLNTPAHHRVHHASNEACLDRNYGGVLIVFDRLFGTLAKAPADEPLRYGLVGGHRSYNPVGIALGGWVHLLENFTHAPSFTAKARALFGPPGGSSDTHKETQPVTHPARMPLAAGVLFAFLAALTATLPAHAQSAPGQGVLRQACKADYQRLCKDTQPGGGRILACLKSHDADLSPDCKQGLAQTPAPK